MRRVPISPDDLPPRGGPQASFELPDRAAHYLRDVLRLEAGARVELFDGEGRTLLVALDDVATATVRVTIIEDRLSDRGESPCAVTLLQAMPRGDRWSWVLEKATELGVAHVVPLTTERTVVQVDARKVEARLQRWHAIAAGAARQSGRTRVPTIDAPQSVQAALEGRGEELQLVAHTGGATRSLSQALEAAGKDGRPGSVAVWIGPEGGFTEREVARLEAAGVQAVSLGPRILRSETAGVVAVALAQAHLGDLD